AGHARTVHGRTRARVDPLVGEGATAADSPAAVAAVVDAVVTMLPDTPDVEAVVDGPEGVLAGARPGLLVVDMSTIDPEAARALAARAAAAGVAFLDAPVSGGEQGAIAGTLSIMVGGERAAFERAAPLFAALGRQVTYMGGSGQGQMTKLVNQVVGATTLAAVAEGVLFAAGARDGARGTGRARRRGTGGGPGRRSHPRLRPWCEATGLTLTSAEFDRMLDP